ncbi:MAG: hypothetical protein SAJ12_11885 [Jaaginema sp. PMC 1079.18]|nr:hypothetical protein [Jaaginema sp. PMC 1080.18]MEC4851706.1 hypothetical protein [Jaaginema sp. PMC 1079.18]MEC4865053.1 hypothetical protein [Jaaginema sp. PMC 1078.18]
MNDQEQRLQALIASVQQRSPGWRVSLNRLIVEIQQLPGLTISPHPDYYEALNDTLLHLVTEIHDFVPQHPSLVQSLTAWINGKLRLKYRVRELYNSERDRLLKTPQAEFRAQSRKAPLSLDKPIANTGNETFGDRLAVPSLWEVREQLERDRLSQKHNRIGRQLQAYIAQDPEGKLQQCHPGQYPDCHCQILSQRLLLKNPPDKLAQIAQDFKINYHTLNWHWRHKALPLLRSLAIELGYSASKSQKNN